MEMGGAVGMRWVLYGEWDTCVFFAVLMLTLSTTFVVLMLA